MSVIDSEDRLAFALFMDAAQSGMIASCGFESIAEPDADGERWRLNLTAHLGRGPSDPVTMDIGDKSGRVFSYRGKFYLGGEV